MFMISNTSPSLQCTVSVATLIRGLFSFCRKPKIKILNIQKERMGAWMEIWKKEWIVEWKSGMRKRPGHDGEGHWGQGVLGAWHSSGRSRLIPKRLWMQATPTSIGFEIVMDDHWSTWPQCGRIWAEDSITLNFIVPGQKIILMIIIFVILSWLNQNQKVL